MSEYTKKNILTLTLTHILNVQSFTACLRADFLPHIRSMISDRTKEKKAQRILFVHLYVEWLSVRICDSNDRAE